MSGERCPIHRLAGCQCEAMRPPPAQRQHEPTCAYYGLPFKAGSGNRICSCPGRATSPTESVTP